MFDLGFITFNKNGNIIVSEHLDDAENIGVSGNMCLTLENEHQKYMDFHRDVMFERNI